MTGEAENVTFVPLQLLKPVPEVIVTEGVTEVETVIVIVFEVRVVAVAQVALEVNVQDTISLFDNELFE